MEFSRPVFESGYLETEEGLFFAVKGFVHPPDRFLACLRYVPDPRGDRRRQKVLYRRLYHFAEQEHFLQAYYPQYLAFEPTIHATLQSVPRQSVSQFYDPRIRLQELSQGLDHDPVEKDAVAFADLLQKESGVSPSSLGISGSLLVGLHTFQSDLDFTVHGAHNCQAVRQTLKSLLANGKNESIRRLDRQGLQALYAERVADTLMPYQDFIRSEKDKVIQGRFRERTYFIRFLKEPEEIGENYGDRCYGSIGRVEILATVVDDRDAIYTPCRYLLEKVQFPYGDPTRDVREIVSYRGRFCEQARAGDLVRSRGALEQVQERSGFTWHRLLLGNHKEDVLFVQR